MRTSKLWLNEKMVKGPYSSYKLDVGLHPVFQFSSTLRHVERLVHRQNGSTNLTNGMLCLLLGFCMSVQHHGSFVLMQLPP